MEVTLKADPPAQVQLPEAALADVWEAALADVWKAAS